MILTMSNTCLIHSYIRYVFRCPEPSQPGETSIAVGHDMNAGDGPAGHGWLLFLLIEQRWSTLVLCGSFVQRFPVVQLLFASTVRR